MKIDTKKPKIDSQIVSQTEKKNDLSSATEPLGRRRFMDEGIQLIKKRKYGEFWQQYCGYIDFSIKEIMDIQKNLLLKQLPLLNNSELGKSIMRGATPKTIEEFRSQVPLTTYADYAKFLLDRREDVLPAKPLLWGHTSGRTGEYDYKWCPITSEVWEEVERLSFAMFTFSSCKRRGDVRMRLNDKILYGAAPVPYMTGLLARYAWSRIFDYLPSIDDAEKMSFQERGKQGILQALTKGIDFYQALPSVMVTVGARMGQGGGKKDIKALLRNPRFAARILKGVIKSKLAHRPMLPKDVWSPKGLVLGGSDGSVYQERIREMWGRSPLDLYASTEAMVIAMQTWDYEALTFYPYFNFFEFIPEEDYAQTKIDSSFKPRALLLDEVEAGQNYQLVLTNFNGGPFTRYILGDMVKITALRNEKLNIDIPQMVYHSRVDDMIDIAGFTRLTETVIWKSLEQSGIAYEDWTARKEITDKPILKLYIEMKGNGEHLPEQIADLVHERLVEMDKPYAELVAHLGLKPLEVTMVPSGAFSNYMLEQMKAGVELGRLKPSHINPSDKVVASLLNESAN
ncbi:GH3 auxin-responsive promoter family protein [Chloroflexota bacterium]